MGQTGGWDPADGIGFVPRRPCEGVAILAPRAPGPLGCPRCAVLRRGDVPMDGTGCQIGSGILPHGGRHVCSHRGHEVGSLVRLAQRRVRSGVVHGRRGGGCLRMGRRPDPLVPAAVVGQRSHGPGLLGVVLVDRLADAHSVPSVLLRPRHQHRHLGGVAGCVSLTRAIPERSYGGPGPPSLSRGLTASWRVAAHGSDPRSPCSHPFDPS